MANTAEKLGLIVKNLSVKADNLGFHVIIPEGTEKGAPPVSESNGKYTALFSGDKGTFKLEVSDQKIYLKCTLAKADMAVENDFSQESVSLFEEDSLRDQDIRSMSNEFGENIEKFYSAGQTKKSKLPTPVSKNAAKSGSVYYDTVTLGARISQIYPELKDEYKANIEKYGEFLVEDFFLNHGNAYIIDTIRENNPQKMRKLFNCLNEIYNDGTNEVQGVVVVTILGSLRNDEQLLANCVDYMDDMTLAVIEANKYLAKSKSANAKLENPPAYKPKKQKKKSSFLSQMGM